MVDANIPVGRSGFADIRKNGFYYIDKSRLIEELLKTDATQVTLITRPRRFGKTLGMSMLAEFFDIRKNSRNLFSGLEIANERNLCEKWMNQYPTLFLSFRTVDGLNFDNAYSKLAAVIADIYDQHYYLMESQKLTLYEKNFFRQIVEETATQAHIENSLLMLTKMLAAHYGKPAILLIDEYDVPLANAGDNGYYAEMLAVTKGVLSVLKDNDSLKFAVITGCLRIAKESIFTGTNNLVSDTISDTRLNECFGFTQADVNKLLQDTKLTNHADEIKKWYDGYCFGDCNVYCPWDVMNHVRNLILNPTAAPVGYWENTSHNAIIRQFLDNPKVDVKEKFETLLSGGYIIEPIIENLTYNVLNSSEDNIWTLLYFTGYLTKIPSERLYKDIQAGYYALGIPNAGIMELFRKNVKEWVQNKNSSSDRTELFAALWEADEEKLTQMISDTLFDTISYHDYNESFYHAFLIGLASKAGYKVESNYENGFGRPDIVIKDRRNRRAIVIETKIADSESNFEQECRKAIQQIEEKQYTVSIERSGYNLVIRLGIAFWRKQCLVKKG